MNGKPASTESATTTWLREALGQLLRELALFGRTFAAFLLHPGRSAGAWQTGARTFMNPLGFGATAAGVYWGITSVLATLWPIPGPDRTTELGEQLTTAVGPYVHYGLLGIAMHVALRGLGSRHHVLGSIGIAVFAGGSVGTVAALLATAGARWFGYVRGTSSLQVGGGDAVALVLFVTSVFFYALICLTMIRALNALHRAPAWKGMIAIAFAIMTTALLFGSVLPDGNYGWRPYIRIEPDDGLEFSVGFQG